MLLVPGPLRKVLQHDGRRHRHIQGRGPVAVLRNVHEGIARRDLLLAEAVALQDCSLGCEMLAQGVLQGNCSVRAARCTLASFTNSPDRGTCLVADHEGCGPAEGVRVDRLRIVHDLHPNDLAA